MQLGFHALPMLVEGFVVGTSSENVVNPSLVSGHKDVGIFHYDFQPQLAFRHGFKKSSTPQNGLAISECHIFATQSGKAVVHVYNRAKGNQEATIPFPERISCIAYAKGTGILIMGTESGKLVLWEFGTGRVITRSSHLQAVSSICVTENGGLILTGGADATVDVWSLTNLVSFAQPSPDDPRHGSFVKPLRTFDRHRNAITALACGHSRYHTNFAASVSHDRTLYIWQIGDCQVLRTILLPFSPTCLCIDPADRAIYAGYEQGALQTIDLYRLSAGETMGMVASIYGNPKPLLAEMNDRDLWRGSETQSRVNCLALSYDGTQLISGHENGKLMLWDVGKGRLSSQLVEFGYPVTNLEMLRPEFPRDPGRPPFTIPSVVKPQLELSGQADNGTCGIPANYILHGQVDQAPVSEAREQTDFHNLLTCSYFPPDVLDEILPSIVAPAAGPNAVTDMPGRTLAESERLEEKVLQLSQKLAAMNEAAQKLRDRKLAREKRREEIGLKKREAYFAAKQRGRDPDLAMKEWSEKEEQVDAESDDDGPDLLQGLEPPT